MRRPGSRPSAPDPCTTRILRVGAEGDGIGALPDGAPLYVPFSLPDETVRVRPLARRGDGWAARLDAVIAPSPERVEPACRHFGACGGCALQHWAREPYLAWKTNLLRAALVRAGFADPPLAPIVATPPGARRRMDLAVRRAEGKVRIGLHRQRSAEVVDISACPVLHPALEALIAPLRSLLGGIAGLRRAGSVIANLLDSGPDVLLRTDAPLTLADRQRLTSFARDHRLPRLSWACGEDAPEPLCVLGSATIALSGVTVAPPPGAFLQASAAAEAAIRATVLAGLPEAAPGRMRIAELYAGCGTLTFALAAHGRVTAFEGDADAAGALRQAARRSGLEGRIAVATRDLARQPLASSELAVFDALVLDPPHAGAALQMPAIVAARVPRLVYVSCNPAALARDARMIAASGYVLLAATPIDQFLWSPRLEAVAVFTRA